MGLVAAFLGSVAIVLGLESSTIPLFYEVCEKAKDATPENCTSYNFVSYFFLKTAEILDTASVVITALSTIAIATFTYFLMQATVGLRDSTDKLFKAGESQIALVGGQLDVAEKAHQVARHQYFATHRPRLGIRRISVEPSGNGKAYRTQWLVSNTGSSNGKIIESNVTLKFCTSPLPAIPQYDAETNTMGEISLEPGTSHECEKILEHDVVTEIVKRLSQKDHNPQKLHFFGRIIYADVMGVKRDTGFCFRYDEMTERFEPVYDSNYIYNE